MTEVIHYNEKQYLIDETCKANAYKSKEEIAETIEEVFPGDLPNFTFEITKTENILRCVITDESDNNVSKDQLPVLARQFYNKLIKKYLWEV